MAPVDRPPPYRSFASRFLCIMLGAPVAPLMASGPHSAQGSRRHVSNLTMAMRFPPVTPRPPAMVHPAISCRSTARLGPLALDPLRMRAISSADRSVPCQGGASAAHAHTRAWRGGRACLAVSGGRNVRQKWAKAGPTVTGMLIVALSKASCADAYLAARSAGRLGKAGESQPR